MNFTFLYLFEGNGPALKAVAMEMLVKSEWFTAQSWEPRLDTKFRQFVALLSPASLDSAPAFRILVEAVFTMWRDNMTDFPATVYELY